MSSFFLLAVLSMPAHYPHPRAVPYVGPVNFVGKYAPRWIDYSAYSYGPSGGVLAAGLLNAPGALTVSPLEERLWLDYVKELDGAEREAMLNVWRQADVIGRRKLLTLLAGLRAEIAANEAKEAEETKKSNAMPLTAEEQAKWAAYLKKLKDQELANAKKAWADADNAGKRRLLKLVVE